MVWLVGDTAKSTKAVSTQTTYYNIYQEPDDDQAPDDQGPDMKKIKVEGTTPMTHTCNITQVLQACCARHFYMDVCSCVDFFVAGAALTYVNLSHPIHRTQLPSLLRLCRPIL